MSAPDFKSWWLTGHRHLAERLPGLVRHSFNVLPDDAPYDAMVEQWFDTTEAMNSCYGTDAGRAVVADSAQHTSLRIRLVADAYEFDIAVTGSQND